MKKSKIICLVICTLMIVTVFPVVGLPIQTAEMKNLNVTQSRTQPPTPGYAPIPPADALLDSSILRERPEITTATMDDVVVSIIEQVDESIFLSYEENLTVNGPRPTESAACVAAADYIYNQFESMGLTVQYCPWSYAGYDSDNVEATLEGTDETSDDIYIICAHYDTVSASPGADDDTSGTAAVLIAASIMSQYQFNHTIKFVAFSGEEQGLLGSAVYASEAASQGWDIIGVLNCDMISYAVTSNDGNNLIVFENTASEWLYTYTFNINTEYDEYIQLTLDHGGSTWGSDHNSFWDEGYDALFYFEYTETPYYHTSQDTMQHINATYAVKNMRLILATLAELAEAGLLSNPPATPVLTGPNSGVIDEMYTYHAVTTEPDGENVYYYFDWGDGTNSGWIGPFNSGQEGAAQKSWNSEGTYTVKAKAKDINGVQSSWSTPIVVTILTDRPPETPTITGPAEGKPDTFYKYSLITSDPDGDMVYYFIDWGDNTTSGWIGPFSSGATASKTHMWAEEGTYTIQAKAKDSLGAESGWATLEVTMPTSFEPTNPLLRWFFQHFPNAFPWLRQLLGL
ncbi:MAG TPA: M28 family peptidase [Candidatus Thermoplasmatota archaeon]|nr:M28 family peptidase [Candidatus Thermoplasmatota archaeon]